MTYGTSLGLTLPTVGTTPGPEYATLVNTALQALIDRLETKVTPSGIDVNADLSFRSGSDYYGAIDLHRAGFRALSAALAAGSYPGALYRVGTDLFYNDGSGNQIQLTSAGAVNISTTGNITGSGYGTGGVEINWDGVNSRYLLKSGSGVDAYADVTVSDVIFRDGSGNEIRMQAPALGANYTLTLPSALPSAGTAAILAVDSTGAISHSKTPTVDGLTANGAVTVNANLTVASGDFKHPARTRLLSPYVGIWSGDSWVLVANSTFDAYLRNAGTAGGSEILVFPLMLNTGERLLDVTLHVRGDVTNVMTARVYRSVFTGAITQLGSDASSGSGDQELFIGSLNVSPASNESYYVVVTVNASDVDFRVYGVEYRFDRP